MNLPVIPSVLIDKLKIDILESLSRQGFRVKGEHIYMPENPTKNDFRNLNNLAMEKKLKKSGPGVKRFEKKLIQYIANGNEVVPEKIQPKLIVVQRESEHELLFRYACLHWSIPVSSGYGRRLRFLVFDENNGKLIGLFGLGDPVYSMRARDRWIGWDRLTKANHLYHTMDAFVLGAVPPYSFLLCGKLVALLVCCNEVRNEFYNKYKDRTTFIRQKKRQPYLALVTTTSALGRSSIYNRLRANNQQYWVSIGFTQGSGEFHFSNGVYDDIRTFVEEYCKPTAKHQSWGTGFRNKREIIRKCLAALGLSANLIYHGINRELFAAPLAADSIKFLNSEVETPCFYDRPAAKIGDIFKERWLLKRAAHNHEYSSFSREQYQLWPPNLLS